MFLCVFPFLFLFVFYYMHTWDSIVLDAPVPNTDHHQHKCPVQKTDGTVMCQMHPSLTRTIGSRSAQSRRLTCTDNCRKTVAGPQRPEMSPAHGAHPSYRSIDEQRLLTPADGISTSGATLRSALERVYAHTGKHRARCACPQHGTSAA